MNLKATCNRALSRRNFHFLVRSDFSSEQDKIFGFTARLLEGMQNKQ